jgi:NAD(P)-dependent dehydrogenase (short-subunit alcohol dehydrogenase family)
MDLDLTKKSVLVTGSSAGIGAAIARTLAREGARVIVHGRNASRVQTIAGEISNAGAEAVGVAGDLATNEGAAHVITQATASFGGVDILINNAGSYAAASWFETSPESWRSFYEADVLSAVRLIHAVVPRMRDVGWGRIINIATGMATAPPPTMLDYAAAKTALINATLSLAKALAGTGITVNAISPGLIATDSVERVLRETAQTSGWGQDWHVIQKRWITEVLHSDLVPRLGTVNEIADLVAFVASPRASYIHGANLRVDGGLVPSINQRGSVS